MYVRKRTHGERDRGVGFNGILDCSAVTRAKRERTALAKDGFSLALRGELAWCLSGEMLEMRDANYARSQLRSSDSASTSSSGRFTPTSPGCQYIKVCILFIRLHTASSDSSFSHMTRIVPIPAVSRQSQSDGSFCVKAFTGPFPSDDWLNSLNTIKKADQRPNKGRDRTGVDFRHHRISAKEGEDADTFDGEHPLGGSSHVISLLCR